MKEIVQILAVIVTGPLLGVEFGVAAFTNPILQRLPDAAYRQARSTGGRILGTAMPFWYIGAVALLIAATLWSPGPLLITAVVLMGLVMLLTLTTLVPINNRVSAGFDGDGAGQDPEQFHELVGRWDRLHWVRVGLLAGTFVLLVLAGSGM
ncbi:anthrone oxygenase family protein [Mycolicibacterium septicum]|uniref:Anthrone oxygenase family protein n=1 Tax=Mycolicibacterium septicum TaxID=98668 RepID=A0ABW9LWZ9_9MYCO